MKSGRATYTFVWKYHEQGKKAFALSADRGFQAEYKDFFKLKAKGAELSVRICFGILRIFRNFRKFRNF